MKIAMKRISLLVVAVFCCANMIKAAEVEESRLDQNLIVADRATSALSGILMLVGTKNFVENSTTSSSDNSCFFWWIAGIGLVGLNGLINVGAAARAKKEKRRRRLLIKISVSAMTFGVPCLWFINLLRGCNADLSFLPHFIVSSAVMTGWGCYDLYALARYGFSELK